jgi:hypothetical protein
MRALDTSLGCWRIRANHVDVEVLHSAAELRGAIATNRVLTSQGHDVRALLDADPYRAATLLRA